MRHEITKRIPLLDEKGRLTQVGYARRLLPAYRRSDIKSGKSHLKEQDRYLICSGDAAVALSITGSGPMRYAGISFLDTDERATRLFRSLSLRKEDKLPESSAAGDCRLTGSGFGLHFLNQDGKRTLIAHVRDLGPKGSFYAKLELSDPPEESLVLAVPFGDSEFCYTQRMVALRASGQVQYGDKSYTFCKNDSFGTLQWSRGVFDRPCAWYGASAAGLWQGLPFGFSLGRGFTRSPEATENMLFYNGKASVLGDVSFHIEAKTRVWNLKDPEERINLRFTPLSGCASSTGICRGHLIYGKYEGTARLDDGRVVEVSDLPGFAESERFV